jgi:eukaryotic-like serine/threonine-protein kinase
MSSADPHQVPIGTILEGKFRLTQEIGRGGMAAVFEAENVDIGKRVAVKLLSSELITSRIVRERFIREARASAAIHSPYICQVFDSGMYQDRPFLVMELLIGESLYDHMSRVRHMDAATLLRIIKHVTRGLEKAHAAGVVHRDLKPENIFLTQNDDQKLVAKILDFGLAKFYESRDGSPEGALFGTPAYMSPEQARGQGEVDFRADLWALGCITYECLTGTTVWDVQQGVAMILAQIARGELPDPGQRRPDLPPSFGSWFQRALHPDLNERYQSATEFYQALELALTDSAGARASASSGELLSGSTHEAQRALAPPVTSEPSAKKPWRAIGALLGTAALVLGGYAVWLFGPTEMKSTARSVLSGVAPSQSQRALAEAGPGADGIAEAQALFQNDQPREALRILGGAKGEHPHVALSLITHAEVAMNPAGPCQLSGLGRPRPFDIVAPSSRPTLTLGRAGLLLAWSDAHENAARRNIYTTLLDDALRRVGSTQNVSPEANLAISPLISARAGGLVLAYWDSGATPGVFARHLSDEGNLLSPVSLLSAPKKEKYFPSLIATSDQNLWALWSEMGPNGYRQIIAVELDKNLKIVGTPRLLTVQDQGDATEPVGQIVAGELFIAYQVRFKNSDSEIRLASFGLDELGKATATTPPRMRKAILLRSAPKQAEPSLECDAAGCIVAWDDENGGAFAAFVPRPSQTPLWHREFSPKGKRPALGRAPSGAVAVAFYSGDRVLIAMVGPEGVGEPSVISKVSGLQPSPHIIPGKANGEWYLAWRDFEAGHLEVFVARATCKPEKGT